MNKDYKNIITWVLLNKIKLIETDYHTYYGTPAQLIDDLLKALSEYEIIKLNNQL